MKKESLPRAYYAHVGEGHANTDWLQKSCKNKLIYKTGQESQRCYYSALQRLYLHCKTTVIVTVLQLIKIKLYRAGF